MTANQVVHDFVDHLRRRDGGTVPQKRPPVRVEHWRASGDRDLRCYRISGASRAEVQARIDQIYVMVEDWPHGARATFENPHPDKLGRITSYGEVYLSPGPGTPRTVNATMIKAIVCAGLLSAIFVATIAIASGAIHV